MPNETNKLVAKRSQIAGTAAIAIAILLGAFVFSQYRAQAAGVPAAPLDEHSVTALTSLDQAMESVLARVTPAVVNIAVTSKVSPDRAVSDDSQQEVPPGMEQFFGPSAPQRAQPLQHGIGSGVIISPDGYIVTNNHVVEGAVQVQVTLHDRRIMKARVVGVDKLTDLAVLKIDATNLPSIAWGDSTKLEPGETVLAFGSPFGFFRFSVTRGIVSAVDAVALGGSMCITLLLPSLDIASVKATEVSIDKQLTAGYETGWNIYDPLMLGRNKPIKVQLKTDPKSGQPMESDVRLRLSERRALSERHQSPRQSRRGFQGAQHRSGQDQRGAHGSGRGLHHQRPTGAVRTSRMRPPREAGSRPRC